LTKLKKSNQETTIIILATNEEKVLKKTLSIIYKNNKKNIKEFIIITPNFVTKGCLLAINELKTVYKKKLMHFYQPKKFPGYGGASIYGISLVKSKYLILCDADGETDPYEVKNLIKTIGDSEDKIVSCSRWMQGNWLDQYAFVDYFLNWFFQKLTSFIFLSNLTDFTVGYRIYPTKLMKKIKFKNLNQSFSLESILIPIKKGIKIIEIPYNFKKRTEGVSKNNFLNKLKYVKTLIECRFRINY